MHSSTVSGSSGAVPARKAMRLESSTLVMSDSRIIRPPLSGRTATLGRWVTTARRQSSTVNLLIMQMRKPPITAFTNPQRPAICTRAFMWMVIDLRSTGSPSWVRLRSRRRASSRVFSTLGRAGGARGQHIDHHVGFRDEMILADGTLQALGQTHRIVLVAGQFDPDRADLFHRRPQARPAPVLGARQDRRRAEFLDVGDQGRVRIEGVQGHQAMIGSEHRQDGGGVDGGVAQDTADRGVPRHAGALALDRPRLGVTFPWRL